MDVNDNSPEFLGSKEYQFSTKETVGVGETLYTSVAVRDPDAGGNGVVDIACDEARSPEACAVFEVETRPGRSPGSYVGLVKLKSPLDYETRSSYDMVIVARDRGILGSLESRANVLIDVQDVQDQSPLFLNAPYTATVPENVEPGTQIFDIMVKDGDTGIAAGFFFNIFNSREKKKPKF